MTPHLLPSAGAHGNRKAAGVGSSARSVDGAPAPQGCVLSANDFLEAAQLSNVNIPMLLERLSADNLLFKMSVADWDAVMSVHLRGTFLCTRAAQRHMAHPDIRNKITKHDAAGIIQMR